MLRKRFLALIYLFCLLLLFVGGFAYIALREHTARYHYYESAQRLLSLFNYDIHNSLLIKSDTKIKELTDRILNSDSSLQMIVIDNGESEISSFRESRSDEPIDTAYVIALDDIPPEDMLFHVVRGLGLRGHKTAYFSKNYFSHEKVIGRVIFSLRYSDQFNSYMKTIFIGFAFIFLIVCALSIVLVSFANRLLLKYGQLIGQINSINYEDIGLLTPLERKEDEVENISQIFAALIEEIKKNYADLKDQNDRLNQSKSVFTTFLDSLDEAIVIRDKFRNVVYANAHFAKLIGIKVDLIGKKLDSFLPPKIDGVDFNLDMEIVDDLSSLSKVIEYENRFFEVKKFCIPAEYNGYMVATVVNELTGQIRATKEKAALQRQMFLSSKLASLGVLASGVAHEMYNPMTVLQGNIDFISKEEELTLTGKKRLEKVYSSLQKMRDFVDRLRLMDRPGNKAEYKSCHLNSIVTNVQQLLASSLNTYGIELSVDLSYDLPPFLGEASLIENALINLFINTREAFDKVSDGREMRILIRTLMSPAGNICLEFTDNACGIPPADQDKLFDPLFTTSEVKNNGLGLTLVREIIHQHDGDLFFFSQENEGTTFKIFLPRHHDGDEYCEMRYRPRGHKNFSKDHTLLFMPQNSDFGEVLRDFLLTHYNVVICNDLNELTEGLAKSCDLALGEWPIDEEEGLKLVESVRKISPQIPLVVMGRNISDDRLLKDIFAKGAQEAVFRDFSKLDILHDIIRKHLNA